MACDNPIFGQPSDAQNPGGSDNRLGYPHPWLDYASTIMPSSLTQVLRWAEFIWNTQGTYRQACQRTVRYFITNLVFGALDDEQVMTLRDIYNKDLRITQRLSDVGDNFLGYGNVFVHPSLPFQRFLSCKCGFVTPFDVAADNKLYDWRDFTFRKSKAGCPQCGAQHNDTPWQILDKEERDLARLRLKIMSPHEMEIGFDPYSEEKVYYWNIPAQLIDGIRNGVPLVLRNIPREILEVVAGGERRFEFDQNVMFHQGDGVLAGVYTGGWGLPRVLSNFRLAFHYQVLNRFDQAIAMDYVNGLRVISPAGSNSGNGAGDPLIGVGGSQFSSNIKRMLKQHKQDPNTWHTSPIPLQYQLFGGEGTQLSPKELITSKLDEWLDATGIPAELFHANLSVQSMPSALRIFENSWPEITSLYNNILSWLAQYSSRVLRLPNYTLSLEPVSQADDMERRHIMLQLMAGQQVAPQTALRTFGITDPREELRKTFEWQRMTAEEEKKFEETMEDAQKADQIKQEWQARSQQANAAAGNLGGVAPGGGPGGAPMDPQMMGGMGGDPMQPNPDAMSSPESMMGEAQRLAEQIVSMEASARRSALVNLKKQNETLHALVKQRVTDLEQQAKQQGVTMLRQQGQMM